MPVIGKADSHCKIFKKVGEDGMGVVYQVEDQKLTRTVVPMLPSTGLTRDSKGR
jgi:hypothetical protein